MSNSSTLTTMPTIRPVGPADLDAIAGLMNGRLKDSGEAWRERLKWQCDANPWLDDEPAGMALVEQGRVVGYHFKLAQPMWLGGVTRVAYFGLDLFVESRFRGGLNSVALVKSIAATNSRSIVAASTANEISLALWSRLGAKVQVGGDVALVKPVSYARLAIAAAERALRGAPPTRVPRAWRAAAPAMADIALPQRWSGRSLSARPELAAQLWDRLRESYPLSTDRSTTFLRWRYGSRSPGGALIGIFDPSGGLRAWYAFRLSPRGGAVRIEVFKLLDFLVASEDGEAIARAAQDMALRARGLADIIEARGMRSEIRRRLQAAGFRPRKLPSNPFLVVAPKLARDLPPPDTWHLVPADGDAGFA
jgi:hypothetical protein